MPAPKPPKRRGVYPQTATKYTRPKAKAPKTTSAPKGNDILGDIGRFVGGVFPAGRLGGTPKAGMSTVGALGKIMKGK